MAIDSSSVPLVDEVDDDPDEHGLLRRVALGDQQGHGDEGVVGNALGAVRAVEGAVLL